MVTLGKEADDGLACWEFKFHLLKALVLLTYNTVQKKYLVFGRWGVFGKIPLEGFKKKYDLQ